MEQEAPAALELVPELKQTIASRDDTIKQLTGKYKTKASPFAYFFVVIDEIYVWKQDSNRQFDKIMAMTAEMKVLEDRIEEFKREKINLVHLSVLNTTAEHLNEAVEAEEAALKELSATKVFTRSFLSIS
jgi:hypothetical protein